MLRSVAGASTPPTVAELARAAGVHRTTAWRLLATLELHELVAHDELTGRYRLGAAIGELARATDPNAQLLSIVRSHLERFVSATGLTANVNVLHGESVVAIDQVSPGHVLSVDWVGRDSPLHASAAGKMALALMAPSDRDRLLARPLQRLTSLTVCDKRHLRRQLAEARDRGFATVVGELEPGLNGVSVALDLAERERVFLSAWGAAERIPRRTLPTLGRSLLTLRDTIGANLSARSAA